MEELLELKSFFYENKYSFRAAFYSINSINKIIMYKHIIIQLLLLAAIGCSNYTSIEFSETHNIEVSELNYDSFCPNFLLSIPGYLILVKNENDTIFELVNIESGKVKRFGPKGRGPNEFLYIIDAYNDIFNKKVVFVDGNKKLAYIYSYEDLINNEYDNPIIKSVPKEIANYSGLRITKSGWVYGNLNGDGILSILNYDQQIKHTSFSPQLPYNLPNNIKGYAYYSAIDYCDFHKKIVVALRYFPTFQIIDIDGNITNSIFTESNFDYPEFADGRIIPSKNSEIFYWQVITSPKHIYLLRANTIQGNFENDLLNGTSIEVYNWEGKPIAKYNMDYAFANITIDFETKTIFGLSDKNLYKCLSKIDLSNNNSDFDQ